MSVFNVFSKFHQLNKPLLPGGVGRTKKDHDLLKWKFHYGHMILWEWRFFLSKRVIHLNSPIVFEFFSKKIAALHHHLPSILSSLSPQVVWIKWGDVCEMLCELQTATLILVMIFHSVKWMQLSLPCLPPTVVQNPTQMGEESNITS